MQVTLDMVRHMATLSRLELTDEEVARFADQLSAILSYASHLPVVSGHTEPHTLRLDEDEVREEETEGASLLRNALALENGYVKVPAILDRSES
ncbi:MAG TPA: Asp-tRNA(Asn)/Glu-tRNA(Gln) amidotransferase subunit GatC [Patescibacteria group bacterium]